jgi:hypothetical protein
MTPKMVVAVMPKAIRAANTFIGTEGARRAGGGAGAAVAALASEGELVALGVGDGAGLLGGLGVRLSLMWTLPANESQAGAGSPPGSRS